MKDNTLKIFVCDKVGNTVESITFSCTQNDKQLIIEAPEFYSPSVVYLTSGMARAPSVLSWSFIRAINVQST